MKRWRLTLKPLLYVNRYGRLLLLRCRRWQTICGRCRDDRWPGLIWIRWHNHEMGRWMRTNTLPLCYTKWIPINWWHGLCRWIHFSQRTFFTLNFTSSFSKLITRSREMVSMNSRIFVFGFSLQFSFFSSTFRLLSFLHSRWCERVILIVFLLFGGSFQTKRESWSSF